MRYKLPLALANDARSVSWSVRKMERFASGRCLLVCCLLLCIVVTGGRSRGMEMRTCDSLTAIPLCSPLYENVTFPNLRGHQSQEDANQELSDWQILIDVGCSLYLRHFLCAYYVPFCASVLPPEMEVRPCRELCSHVRNACEPIMNANDASWPGHLNCHQFPEKTEEPWCFGPDDPSQLTENQTVVVTTYEPLPNLSAVSHSTSVVSTVDVAASEQNFTPSRAKILQSATTTPTNTLDTTSTVKESIPPNAEGSTTACAPSAMLLVNTLADILPTSTVKLTVALPSDTLSTAYSSQVGVAQTGAASGIITETEYDGSGSDSPVLNLPLYASSTLDMTTTCHKNATSWPHITANTAKVTLASQYDDRASISDATTTTASGYAALHYHSPSSLHTLPSPSCSQAETLTSLLQKSSVETTLPLPAASTTNLKDAFSTSLEKVTLVKSTANSFSTLPVHAGGSTFYSKDIFSTLFVDNAPVSPTASFFFTFPNSAASSIYSDNASSTSFQVTPASISPHSKSVVTTATLISVLSTMDPSPTTSPHPMQDDSTSPSTQPIQSCQQMSPGGLCQGLGYSNFSLPNLRNHATREEAELELNEFSLLIRMNCSMQLRDFLCHYYLPKCSPDPPHKIFPCQEFCQKVEGECSPLLAAYKLVWPAHMDCQQLPSTNTSLCSFPEEPSPLNQATPAMDGGNTRVTNTPTTILLCALVVTLVLSLFEHL